MKLLDRFIQRQRIRRAVRWIDDDARVLDVGCFDATLFESLGKKLARGVGLDPMLDKEVEGPRWRLLRGRLPAGRSLEGPFDAITMLAVLEHVPECDLPALAAEVQALLAPSGRLILTVPEPAVDRVLTVLRALHLIDGMSLEEHHGFRTAATRALFEGAGLRLLVHDRFQLGLNNLYVFERPASPELIRD